MASRQPSCPWQLTTESTYKLRCMFQILAFGVNMLSYLLQCSWQSCQNVRYSFRMARLVYLDIWSPVYFRSNQVLTMMFSLTILINLLLVFLVRVTSEHPDVRIMLIAYLRLLKVVYTSIYPWHLYSSWTVTWRLACWRLDIITTHLNTITIFAHSPTSSTLPLLPLSHLNS